MRAQFNSNMKLIAVVACILFVTGVLFLSNDRVEYQVSVNNPSQLSSLISEQDLPNSSEPNSEISVLEVAEINNANDILDLEVETKFSFRIGENGKDGLVIMHVTEVSNNPTFTQIQARGEDGVVAVMTLTPTLTNILLKTSSNIFEFIGDNFDGTMSQIAHIDISDDIHAPRSITEPKAIQNTFQSIRVMER